MGRTSPCVDNTEAALTIAQPEFHRAHSTTTEDRKYLLATARTEAWRTKATPASLTLAVYVLETLGDEFDQGIADGIREFLATDYPPNLPTKAQQLATTMTSDGTAGRMAQHFEAMNTRSRPGLIRRALGAMGISCCLISAIHITSDLGARVSADVSRAHIEYCGKC